MSDVDVGVGPILLQKSARGGLGATIESQRTAEIFLQQYRPAPDMFEKGPE
jgi:hypothetical protein